VTGPIVFTHPVARSHLLGEGYVFSLRSSERTTGETWLRVSGRGGSVGQVDVERVREDATEAGLDTLARGSGFEDVEAWLDAVEDVHGSRDLDGLSVYRVDLLDAHPLLKDGRDGGQS